MPVGNETALQTVACGTNWDLAVGIAAIVIAVVSLVFLLKQTNLLRKQIFGEVYTRAQIRELQFYIPAKCRHAAVGFENQQKDTEEVYFKNGKQVQIKRGVKSEVHIRFFWDAPQNLRFFTCGFLDNYKKQTYSGIPVLLDYNIPFVEKEVSKLPRGVYRDWAGHWHVEFGFDRYVAENDCFVVCFTVEGSTIGKFPLHFEVGTREAKYTYTEVLWVEVVSESETLGERGLVMEEKDKKEEMLKDILNELKEMNRETSRRWRNGVAVQILIFGGSVGLGLAGSGATLWFQGNSNGQGLFITGLIIAVLSICFGLPLYRRKGSKDNSQQRP